MHKLFVPEESIKGTIITVTGDDVEHLHALRIKNGEKINVSDGKKNAYEAVLTEMRKSSAIFEIQSVRHFENEARISVTACIALLKGGNCEDVIRQSTELGAAKIVLFSSSNCIAKDREKDGKYAKIARQAAMQSGRDIIPEILTGVSFDEMIDLLKSADLSLFFHEKSEIPFFDVIEKNNLPRSAAFAVGPEGGFTDIEAETAEKNGINVVSMGKRILRAVTAPVCAISVLTSVYDRQH